METNQPITVYRENTSSLALNIAYVSLVIGLIAIAISVWTLYTVKYVEVKEPQTMDKKIDNFFEKQDQELDKVFDEQKEQQ